MPARRGGRDGRRKREGGRGVQRSLFAIRKIRKALLGYFEGDGKKKRKDAKARRSFIRFRHCGQVWVYSFRMTVVTKEKSGLKHFDTKGGSVFGIRCSVLCIRKTGRRYGVILKNPSPKEGLPDTSGPVWYARKKR